MCVLFFGSLKRTSSRLFSKHWKIIKLSRFFSFNPSEWWMKYENSTKLIFFSSNDSTLSDFVCFFFIKRARIRSRFYEYLHTSSSKRMRKVTLGKFIIYQRVLKAFFHSWGVLLIFHFFLTQCIRLKIYVC